MRVWTCWVISLVRFFVWGAGWGWQMFDFQMFFVLSWHETSATRLPARRRLQELFLNETILFKHALSDFGRMPMKIGRALPSVTGLVNFPSAIQRPHVHGQRCFKFLLLLWMESRYPVQGQCANLLFWDAVKRTALRLSILQHLYIYLYPLLFSRAPALHVLHGLRLMYHVYIYINMKCTNAVATTSGNKTLFRDERVDELKQYSTMVLSLEFYDMKTEKNSLQF